MPMQSTTQPLYVPELPAEPWFLIFHFMTSAPIFTSARYKPFQFCHHTTAALSNAALSDKCTLTHASMQQWRALATDILYENIHIGRGISALHAAFSNTEQPEQSIADEHTATPAHHALPVLALLVLLPHLEVFMRPPTCYHDYDHHGCHTPHHHHGTTTTTIRVTTAPPPCFEFPTGMLALPALRRLEWAFDPTGAATWAGSINVLDDVLRAVSALEELVLVGHMPCRLHMGASETPLVTRQSTYWPLWEAFGGQVHVLEMELAMAGGVPMVNVSSIARLRWQQEESLGLRA
ncbi:hypothetical protein F5148DRAFT_1280857 [Russula earlei]|uniref:Uncharacterized protein n=1 Tax=Russula earlei TaxID=71964 RepID=A0ACC0UJS1_9AGAM|nr:hypothetical protein F5148DRAFT_1280857 [Russula earlei]